MSLSGGYTVASEGWSRFVEDTYVKYGNVATDLITKAGYAHINEIGNIAKNFVGHYLHNF
ncbi:hypothetical protein K7432_000912 [Basidiobolus ranarum]|uniref:Uncharacterized protein n=1 Tax=Basidiobolus ranarum TaxID=34480 RepID=A0ABR2X3R6_9FUNG